jgi:nuclear pore complex protein Nup188
VGAEALGSLDRQARALAAEFKAAAAAHCAEESSARGSGGGGGAAAVRLSEAMGHVMQAVVDAVRALEMLDEGERGDSAASPPPTLNKAHSLVSQMSWRPTPLDFC